MDMTRVSSFVRIGGTCLLVVGLLLPAATWAQSDSDIDEALRVFNHAKMLHQEGRFAEAISEYRASLKLDEENAFIYNALGLALAAERQFEGAVESFQRALEINPDLTDVYNNLGTMYAETGKREKAFEAFSLAVRNPNYPTPEKALYNLGRLYLREQNFELAIMHFERALTRNARFGMAHRGLGQTYLAMNEDVQARGQFEKALEQNADDLESNFELARLHQLDGDNEQAVEYYRKVVQIDRQSDIGRLSLASLEALKGTY